VWVSGGSDMMPAILNPASKLMGSIMDKRVNEAILF